MTSDSHQDAWDVSRRTNSARSGSNEAAELPTPTSGEPHPLWRRLYNTVQKHRKAIDQGAATERFAVGVVGVLATFAIFMPRPGSGGVPRGSVAIPALLTGASASGALRVAASNSLPAEKRSDLFPEPSATGVATAATNWNDDVNSVPPPGTFARSFRVRATAYMPIDTPMEGGRWTCTQRDGQAMHGIAVDPDVIPLGSYLWVPGYGHGVADDTGGAIRGHHIDLRMQTRREMNEWGTRGVRVYVLRDP